MSNRTISVSSALEAINLKSGITLYIVGSNDATLEGAAARNAACSSIPAMSRSTI